jgi:hypothetical protein
MSTRAFQTEDAVQLMMTVSDAIAKDSRYLEYVIRGIADGNRRATEELSERAHSADQALIAAISLLNTGQVAPQLKEHMSAYILRHYAERGDRYLANLSPAEQAFLKQHNFQPRKEPHD